MSGWVGLLCFGDGGGGGECSLAVHYYRANPQANGLVSGEVDSGDLLT